MNNCHIINNLQCRKRFCTYGVVEYGPARATFYKFVSRDSNNKDITCIFRRIKMLNMAGVHEVKYTMAVNDDFTLLFQERNNPLKIIQCNYFFSKIRFHTITSQDKQTNPL